MFLHEKNQSKKIYCCEIVEVISAVDLLYATKLKLERAKIVTFQKLEFYWMEIIWHIYFLNVQSVINNTTFKIIISSTLASGKNSNM